MTENHSSLIHWYDWSDEAFEKAEKEDKLIFLDIGASWCHWCHVMDRTTYSDPEVARILSERFIPIKIDADKRPDIQDRYLLGGWPTTAFLIPDGSILTGSTFMPPQTMIQKMREVDALYHEHKAMVTMQVTSMAAEVEAKRAEAETPVGLLSDEFLSQMDRILKRDFDPLNGGFGAEPKFPYPDAVRYAFLRYRKTGDKDMLEIARKTLDAMMKIYDPVWGGFYRYAVNKDWTEPHYEKMLYVQAGAMDNYLEAYQVTGDDRYGEIAAGIKAYVTRFLSDTENGGFYGSQDTDVGSHDPNAELILGEEYYPKDEDERLAMGIPYVDKTVYTDSNGMMVSAYLRLYHAMGDEHAREFALKTADRILAQSMDGGQMSHYFDGQLGRPGTLADQVYFALALVDAYQSSGIRKYFVKAEKLVSFMVGHLQDVMDGGFYFKIFEPRAKGELLERHKPFDENVTAFQLLMELHYLTGYKIYRELAEYTMKAIAYPQIAESIIGVGFAQALDLYLHPPMQIVVVGDHESEQTREMLETSLHTYEPQKLVQVLDPTEHPLTVGDLTYSAGERPLAYVCVQNVCRSPVEKSDELVTVLEDVIGGTPY